MPMTEWVGELRRLDSEALEGRISPDDQRKLDAWRDELASMVVLSQRVPLRPGEKPRRAMPVAQMLPVEIELPTGALRTTTVEVSGRGFAALLGSRLDVGQRLQCLLKLDRRESVGGEAVVAEAKMLASNYRVQFRFMNLSAQETGRLEDTVFRMLLAKLAS